MARHPVVFLDRDGTLIHDAHYLTDPRQVRLYKDVPAALRVLRETGFKLVIVSNQSGIGRGWVSHSTVDRINRRLEKILRASSGVRFDAVLFCPHAPWDKCVCRKPEPGLIRRARRELALDLRKAYMIGDKIIDVLLAKKVGIKGILLLTGHGGAEASQCRRLPARLKPDYIAPRFSDAVRWILKNGA